MKEVSELYRQMLDVFTEKTGFSMDDSADLAVRLYAAAAQLQTLYIYADWALAQSFPQTAEGEYLDRHAALRGIARKDGEKAHGVLRFRVELAREDDLTIPAGTVRDAGGRGDRGGRPVRGRARAGGVGGQRRKHGGGDGDGDDAGAGGRCGRDESGGIHRRDGRRDGRGAA